MSRSEFLLRYADLSRRGIEIAPYFNPTIRKSDGFDVLIMDVFDTNTLRKRALDDAWIPNDRIHEIEEVDLIGDASLIGEVVKKADIEGKVNYIVSSHNFEHLPNPIGFLRGASQALEPGGVLCMAVPDCRACFDHFRMPTRLVDWLAAFHEDRKQPSPESIFDGVAQGCSYVIDGTATTGCDLSSDDPAGFKPNELLTEAYDAYKLA
jgi:SAM-dependent methyltransferase